MINLGLEADFGRLEGIVCWEVDVQEKHAPSIRRITLWHHYPVAKVRDDPVGQNHTCQWSIAFTINH